MKRVMSTLVLVGMLLGSILWVSLARSEADDRPRTFLTPTFGVAPDGQLWAAWVVDTGDDWEIATSRWDGQSWEPEQILTSRPGRWDASPSLVFDVDGVAWLAWSSSTGVDDTLHLSHWTGGGWSPPEEVPVQETMPNRQPALAPDPEGGLWLAWVGFDGNDDEIYAAHWDGSAWSAPERVGADDADPAAYDTQPRLAVGSDGRVWIAWASHNQRLDDEILVSYWDGWRWAAEERVSTDDDSADAYPSLAAADDGTVWLAWHGWPAEDPAAGRRIYVSRRSPSGGWDTETIVSSPLASRVIEERPSLALDALGQPTVIWHVDDGTLGIGYASFNGVGWSSPRWVVQDTVEEGACLMVGEAPWIVWLPVGGDGPLPFEQRVLEGNEVPLPLFEPPVPPPERADVVVNRHVAFGDSITWGLYSDPETGMPVGAYPPRLENKLDTRVVASEVINQGLVGEQTPAGEHRLEWDVLPTYEPNFVEIMEGTNDITHGRPYSDIAGHLEWMTIHCRKADSRALLATLIPRLDSLYDETAIMNGYIAQVAADRNVPLVDNWQSFHNYGDWQSLYIDALHPNSQGMAVLANSWYNGIINGIWWLDEETEPPVTWIASLPTQTACGQPGTVTWTGTDNLSWVVSYDVQKQVGYGAWTNWLVGTQLTSGSYIGYTHNQVIGFRVRGRDVVGNQSAYSAARYTTIVDQSPPYNVQMGALQPVQRPPFAVRWSGADACSYVSRFEVEYRIGPLGSWTLWQVGTHTSAVFGDDEPVQYGQTYYFRVRAYDAADNWAVSLPVSTILAQYTLEGSVLNARHERIAGADASLIPAAPAMQRQPGGYLAYLAEAGIYELLAEHDGFGLLPSRHLSVAADMSGVDMILPPLDNVVSDGDFEPGAWDGWQGGGTFAPTLTSEAHTGYGAALLGGLGELSWLSQPLAVPPDLINPTLSFLVRLDDDAAGSSTVQIELEGTPIGYTHVVGVGDWSHVWIPVDAAVGQQVTLTFTVSDTPAVRLDEVSLGSALSGGFFPNLPLVLRDHD
jgi:lysophospholipase L1-like esterase